LGIHAGFGYGVEIVENPIPLRINVEHALTCCMVLRVSHHQRDAVFPIGHSHAMEIDPLALGLIEGRLICSGNRRAGISLPARAVFLIRILILIGQKIKLFITPNYDIDG